MNLIDGAIIITLFIFAGTNLALGLIHALGGIIGLALGLLVARFYYVQLGDLLSPALFGNPVIANVIAFVLIFFVVSRAFALVVHFAQKLVRWLPLGTFLDRVGGLLLGFIEGVLVLSIILFFLGALLKPESRLGQEFAASPLAQAHLVISKITIPFIPEALRNVRSLF